MVKGFRLLIQIFFILFGRLMFHKMINIWLSVCPKGAIGYRKKTAKLYENI